MDEKIRAELEQRIPKGTGLTPYAEVKKNLDALAAETARKTVTNMAEIFESMGAKA